MKRKLLLVQDEVMKLELPWVGLLHGLRRTQTSDRYSLMKACQT